MNQIIFVIFAPFYRPVGPKKTSLIPDSMVSVASLEERFPPESLTC